jgi:proteasome assembly chaperone (PAC2) family protein
MGIRLFKEPRLKKPDLICGWPGIGNIGLIAIDTLKGVLEAEEFAEIEPWDFFYPEKVFIRDGLLKELQFPTNKFYYQRLEKKDLIFFIGEKQPTEGEGMYATGEKAYQIANLVLDVAEKFGCHRVYTSGASVSAVHHTMKPRVVSVLSSDKLAAEVTRYPNTILTSEMGGRESEGVITGLNGLLLAVAKKRGLESICLMGEIPDWLSGSPFPYPKASKSVLEVFADILGIRIDLTVLDEMTAQIEGIVEKIYQEFPSEIKERYDQRKFVAQAEPARITEQDARWIKEHINGFFKKGGEQGGKRST